MTPKDKAQRWASECISRACAAAVKAGHKADELRFTSEHNHEFVAVSLFAGNPDGREALARASVTRDGIPDYSSWSLDIEVPIWETFGLSTGWAICEKLRCDPTCGCNSEACAAERKRRAEPHDFVGNGDWCSLCLYGHRHLAHATLRAKTCPRCNTPKYLRRDSERRVTYCGGGCSWQAADSDFAAAAPSQPTHRSKLDVEYDGWSLRDLLAIDTFNRQEQWTGVSATPMTPAQRAAVSAHWSAELRAKVHASKERERCLVVVDQDADDEPWWSKP